MAKKKKSQLRPIARGFATTSVPKKVTSEEDTPRDSAPEQNPTTEGEPPSGSEKSELAVQRTDSQTGEDEQLQSIVDRLQERTEKEISRTVKAIDVDRRFAKTLPKLELDPSLIEEILNLASEHTVNDGVIKIVSDESEDKLLARLAITYGVMRRLGFSELRVEECLRGISGVELDEAYDWLYTNATEEELDLARGQESTDSRSQTATQISSTPATPRTPSEFLVPTITPPIDLSKTTFRLNAAAPAFTSSVWPETSQLSDDEPSVPTVDQEDKDAIDLKERVLSRVSQDTDSDTDDLDDNNPNVQYAQVKVELEDALALKSAPGSKFPMSRIPALRSQLQSLQKNYFFDAQEADSLFTQLMKKPRTDVKPPPNAPDNPLKRERNRPEHLRAPSRASQTSATVSDDILDEDGGFFDILEAMPSEVTTSTGTIVVVRDMSLLKHWSGRTPKILLKEMVERQDKYAAISYYILADSNRAKRAAVSIRWDRRKTEEWRMEDVACYDQNQAEQYVATLVLHALSFPSTEGFEAGASVASGGSVTFFRLLPPKYRELWDELEEARKTREDDANKNVWAKLKSILASKLERPTDSNRSQKSATEGSGLHHAASMNALRDTISEELKSSFDARVASPAYQEMLAYRQELPIAKHRAEIIDALEHSQVFVLSGETGCGKSTQVPTFILENELSQGRHCKVFCTEPRRISALSLAQRVSCELGDPPGAVGTMSSLVGYSIRLESVTSRNTRLSFVTNGIALRMLEGGSGPSGKGTAFDEITHIIIDEVHERSIESDFLLIVLKSLLQQRSDLKVILMSATVDAEKISAFFGGCPMLYVSGRTFPVDVYYLEDAVQLTGWSISEKSPYARRLHDKFYRGKNQTDWSEELAVGDDDEDNPVQENVKLEKRYSAETASTINLFDERLVPFDLITSLLERICFEDPSYKFYSAAILIFMPGLAEIRRMNDILSEHKLFGHEDEFRIYPLHSTLSSENQSAVFEIPPPGVRKIVIATNIAETGITIPDITCVIDSGKHREMRFDEKRQISRLVETFVAKSNAAQRRGRAGRVQKGICFHLFTKLRHDTLLVDHPLPEIMRLSLSDLALRIKIMKVNLGSSIEDVLSRAMDPPAAINVQRAISMLVEARALTPSEEITPMGRLLSKLPTDVHLGKFLLIAAIFRCLDPALTIAAALNSKSPFVTPFGLEQEADRAKNSFRIENSDFLTIHNAFSSWRRVGMKSNTGALRKFCRTNFLSHQNLQQIEDLRQQFLSYLIDSSFIQVSKTLKRELSHARGSRGKTRFVMIPEELDVNSQHPALINATLTAGLYPKILSIDFSNGQMRTLANNQQAFFHPSSVNFGRKTTDLGTSHLVYFTIMHSKRLYAWETGPAEDLAMLLLCGESETKLISDATFIDRKVRYQIPPKANVAIKVLRSQLASLLSWQFRGKALSESQLLWQDLAARILGRVKEEEEQSIQVR